MPTALIIDDEPLARTHLRRMLETQGVEVVGEAANAAEALQYAEALRPDILFLDIQMPGLTGMQLAGALQQSSADSLLIFVTGYSEHALEAFDHGALDYLVKPASPARLAKTLARALTRLTDARAREEAARAVTETAAAEKAPLQRLPVRTEYAVQLIRVEEIRYARTRDKRVIIYTPDGEYHTYYTLTHLESLLPADSFFRIHDSCIVRLQEITEILFLGNHTYAVRLAGNEQLPVGRSRYPELQKRLGLEQFRSS
jgi:two-component system, LytTR family, response regulator